MNPSNLFKKNWLLLSIMLLFASTPLESVAVIENFSLAKLMTIIVIFFWILNKCPGAKTPILKLYIPYTTYAILTCIWSIDINSSFTSITAFLLPSLLLSYIISGCLSDTDNIKYVSLAYVAGCIFASINAISGRQALYAAATIADMERASAFGADQNTIAFMWDMGVVVLLCCLRSDLNKIYKALCWLLIAILVFSILITGSRTGVVIMLLIFGLFVLDAGSIKTYIATAIFGVAAFVLMIPLLPETITERLLETRDVADSGDFSGRGEIWLNGWKAFIDENILLGVGYSNFAELYKLRYGVADASHNTYLTYIVEFGLLGCWFFFAILKQMFGFILKIYRNINSKFVFAYLLPFLVVMLTLETEYKRWLFMLGPVIYALYIQSTENYNSQR